MQKRSHNFVVKNNKVQQNDSINKNTANIRINYATIKSGQHNQQFHNHLNQHNIPETGIHTKIIPAKISTYIKMKQEKAEKLQRLRNKIFLEKQKINQNFNAFRSQICQTINDLQEAIIAEIQKQYLMLKQTLKQEQYPNSKKIEKCQGFSPFDFNSQIDLSVSMLQSSLSQGNQNNQISMEQSNNKHTFQLFNAYVNSNTNTSKLLFLYHEDYMQRIMKRVNEKIQAYTKQIKQKHIEYVVSFRRQLPNYNAMGNNVLYDDCKINGVDKQKFNSANIIKNSSQLHKDSPIKQFAHELEFREIYNRLQECRQSQHNSFNHSKDSDIKQIQPNQYDDDGISIYKNIVARQSRKTLKQQALHDYKMLQMKKSPTFNISQQPFFIFHNNADQQLKKEVVYSPKTTKPHDLTHMQISHQNSIWGEFEQNKWPIDPVKVDACQQAVTVQWCEDISVVSVKNISFNQLQRDDQDEKSTGPILCVLHISKEIQPSKQSDNINYVECQYLAMGSKDHNIYIYQLSSCVNNNKAFKLEGHQASVCTLVLFQQNYNASPKKLMISGGDTGCSSLIMWDIYEWTIHSRFNIHEAAITTILPLTSIHNSVDDASIIPIHDNYIVSGSYDRKLKIFNISQNLIEFEQQMSGPISHGCYIDNNKIAIAVAGFGIVIIQVKGSEKKTSDKLNNKDRIHKLLVNIINRIILHDNVVITSLTTYAGTQKVVAGLMNGDLYLIHTVQPSTVYKFSGINRAANKNQAVLSILVINRLNRAEQPILIAGCFKDKQLKLFNWQSQTTKYLKADYQLNFQYGCGISPLMVLTDRKQLIAINQGYSSNQIIILGLNFH